jgi:RHS repeat-associated protein
MPMTERFYSVNGQMMGYESGGVKKDFLTDHLGSITAEIDQTQTRTYDTRYSAYGRNNWSIGTGCGFGWVGSYGYRETGLFHMSHYVRARHYSYVAGNWSTVDPLWPSESAYGYVNGRATTDMDPTGVAPNLIDIIRNAIKIGKCAKECAPALKCLLLPLACHPNTIKKCLDCISPPRGKPKPLPFPIFPNLGEGLFELPNYGKYCGSSRDWGKTCRAKGRPETEPLPWDCIDTACQKHDACLDGVNNQGVNVIWNPFAVDCHCTLAWDAVKCLASPWCGVGCRSTADLIAIAMGSFCGIGTLVGPWPTQPPVRRG